MMASTLAPPLPEKDLLSPIEGGGNNDRDRYTGPGGNGSGGSSGGIDRRYYTGMTLGLAAIGMVFAAFTSAYVVRKGLSDDWRPTQIPAILWLNTALLLASSVTVEKAKRSLSQPKIIRQWWWLTTALGIAFLGGQFLAWQQLAAQGVYLSTNPSSSFLYLLTGSHGIHLLGGVAAMLYLAWMLRPGSAALPGKTPLGVTALYWHFMDGLWVYLFLLLLLWR